MLKDCTPVKPKTQPWVSLYTAWQSHPSNTFKELHYQDFWVLKGIGMMFQECGEPSCVGERPCCGGSMWPTLPLGRRPYPASVAGGWGCVWHSWRRHPGTHQEVSSAGGLVLAVMMAKTSMMCWLLLLGQYHRLLQLYVCPNMQLPVHT